MPYDSRQAIEEVNARLVKIETQLAELLSNHVPHIYQELQRLGSRPSWIVMSFITFLASACSVLLTILVQLLKK